MLTSDQKAAFHRDGVLVLRQGLPRDAVRHLHAPAAALRQAAEHALPYGIRFAPVQEPRSTPTNAEYTWGVNEITRPAFYDPTLINVIAAPAIADAMNALLDQPRAWGQKMLWAPRACDYVLHWHRDVSHAYDSIIPFKPTANDHVQFNAALAYDPSFRVVPGSHRRSLTKDEWAAIADDPCGPMPGEIHLPLEAGDILLMDAHALHRGAVPAGDPRLTLHFSFQAQWVPLWAWGHAEDFAWICSEAFRASLEEAAKAPYRRLTEAVRCKNQYDWLIDHARQQGWTPPPDWQAPPGYAMA
jgi:hypothetical protein